MLDPGRVAVEEVVDLRDVLPSEGAHAPGLGGRGGSVSGEEPGLRGVEDQRADIGQMDRVVVDDREVLIGMALGGRLDLLHERGAHGDHQVAAAGRIGHLLQQLLGLPRRARLLGAHLDAQGVFEHPAGVVDVLNEAAVAEAAAGAEHAAGDIDCVLSGSRRGARGGARAEQGSSADSSSQRRCCAPGTSLAAASGRRRTGTVRTEGEVIAVGGSCDAVRRDLQGGHLIGSGRVLRC